MENSSNSESNRLYSKLSREEAIRRINAQTKAMMEAGTSWIELRSWADSKFSRLPKELKMWKIWLSAWKFRQLYKETSQGDSQS